MDAGRQGDERTSEKQFPAGTSEPTGAIRSLKRWSFGITGRFERFTSSLPREAGPSGIEAHEPARRNHPAERSGGLPAGSSSRVMDDRHTRPAKVELPESLI
jgi:hypothetical protein